MLLNGYSAYKSTINPPLSECEFFPKFLFSFLIKQFFFQNKISYFVLFFSHDFKKKQTLLMELFIISSCLWKCLHDQFIENVIALFC